MVRRHIDRTTYDPCTLTHVRPDRYVARHFLPLEHVARGTLRSRRVSPWKRGARDMKTIVLGAVLIGLLAACGGGSGSPDSGIQFPDGGTACDLFTQSGCAANEKCTWIRAAASPTSQVGKVG